MNNIQLQGTITNIQKSHVINGIIFDKAQLLVRTSDGKLSSINIVFKHFQNKYHEGDFIKLYGNVRSYSEKTDSMNHVHIYVFTYLDDIDNCDNDRFFIDGRICKKGELQTTAGGKCFLRFTLANNIFAGNKKLNSYLPCVCWGTEAKKISNFNVNDTIRISGELKSREYKKYNSNNQFDIHIAHELMVNESEPV